MMGRRFMGCGFLGIGLAAIGYGAGSLLIKDSVPNRGAVGQSLRAVFEVVLGQYAYMADAAVCFAFGLLFICIGIVVFRGKFRSSEGMSDRNTEVKAD